MNKTAESVWANCLDIIKDIVEWQHFKTWFEPIVPVELKGNILLIQVPSNFFYEYLEQHYVTLLAKTLKRQLGVEDYRNTCTIIVYYSRNCVRKWDNNVEKKSFYF